MGDIFLWDTGLDELAEDDTFASDINGLESETMEDLQSVVGADAPVSDCFLESEDIDKLLQDDNFAADIAEPEAKTNEDAQKVVCEDTSFSPTSGGPPPTLVPQAPPLRKSPQG